MNHSHTYNAPQGPTDHRNFPIPNLDNLRPVDAPRDKVLPFHHVPSGSVEDGKRRPEQAPAEPDPEKAIAVEESPPSPKRSCYDSFKHFVRSRPGFSLFVIGSCVQVLGTWKAVTWASTLMDPLFGIDPEREARAYHAIFNVTKEIGERHQQCIRDRADTCMANFDLARQVELSEIDAIRSSNQVKLDGASQKTGHCIMALYDTQAALRDLVLSGGTPPFVEDEAKCSAADKETLLAIAGGDVRDGQNTILSLLREMQKEGETQAEYLKALAIYNRDYFFGQLSLIEADLLLEIGNLAAVQLKGISLMNVTGLNALNGIAACVSPGGTFTCSFPPVSVSLQGVFNTAEAIITVADEQIRLAAMVIATLVERYDWAVDNIEDLVRIFQGIRRVLGRPFDLALDSFGGIDFDKFSDLAPGAFYVPGDLDFPELPDLPPIQPILDELQEEIRKLKGAVGAVAEQVSDELKDKVDELVTKVREAFDGVLEDYDPPKPPGFNTFNLEEISTSFTNKRQRIADLVAAEVNKLGLGHEPLPEADVYVPPAPEVDFNTTSAQVNEASASLRRINLPNIPEWVYRLVDVLFTYFWLWDILHVGWLIVARFRKLADKTAVPIPHVQMPVPPAPEANEPRGRLWQVFAFLTGDLLKILPRAMLVIGFALGFFVYGVSYRHYESGCVATREGTYIGREIVATYIYNDIVVDIIHTQGVEKGRVVAHFNSECQEAQFVTYANQSQQEQHLAALLNEYTVAMAESQRLLNCIDFDAFGDFDSDLATCALPLDTELDSGIAECKWGSCSVECEDMVAEDIQRVVVENFCILEEQWHARFWKFCAMVYIWLWLNLLSTFVQELPPHLFPDMFGSRNVHLSYMRNRETHKIVGREGDAPASVIDKAIASHYFRNKVWAWCKVAFLIIMLSVWIWALVWKAMSAP